jgi:hypothetical protein
MEVNNTTVVVTTYISYVVISVVLTVWVAQTLHKNGRVFLVDVFNGNEALSRFGQSPARRRILSDQLRLCQPRFENEPVSGKRRAGNRIAVVEDRSGFIGFRRTSHLSLKSEATASGSGSALPTRGEKGKKT